MHFISELGKRLIADKQVYDLSRNSRFSEFEFIGVKESIAAIEFIAFVQADLLTEEHIINLRDQFFKITQTIPREFGFKPRGRNPNGLLVFVFAQGCPPHLVQFVKKQTRISHSAMMGAVSVSWSIDLQAQTVHTHNNPVSLFPPVMIMAATAFPGLEYVSSFIRGYQEPASMPNGDANGIMPNTDERLTLLRQTLVRTVNLEELRTLCTDIGIDFENLSGEGKSAKIRELIAYCQRRGQLDNLIQGISATWPSEEWVKTIMRDFP